MGNVDKWIQQGLLKEDISTLKEAKNIPFAETQKYLNKVVINYKLYRMLYD